MFLSKTYISGHSLHLNSTKLTWSGPLYLFVGLRAQQLQDECKEYLEIIWAFLYATSWLLPMAGPQTHKYFASEILNGNSLLSIDAGTLAFSICEIQTTFVGLVYGCSDLKLCVRIQRALAEACSSGR